MRRIFKYQLSIDDTIKVPVPGNRPEVLHVGIQGGVVCVWIIVDPDSPVEETCHLVLRGTGHPLPDECSKANYVGTVHLGPFVWHVFLIEGGTKKKKQTP